MAGNGLRSRITGLLEKPTAAAMALRGRSGIINTRLQTKKPHVNHAAVPSRSYVTVPNGSYGTAPRVSHTAMPNGSCGTAR